MASRADNMGDGQRYETEWEGLQLVVEDHSEHFQAFVYDPVECEVLYTASRVNLDAAKAAAVEYEATARFGPRHDLKPDILATMLVWDVGCQAA